MRNTGVSMIKESDFLAFVNLWNYLGEQQKALSSNQIPPSVSHRLSELFTRA
ncbi:ATP-dependent RNA helicase HrpA [Salmonella enterica subsp. enterica]|uniref:ATP-dependent RNA helicase HrpA n=1 Tax=Salmonella enterica I TaxID=59201 RepID=A0A447U2V7_SALET|nr:ATP-dependent RNA helicase HrpA [Salmonella enterica subsp. enterica]